jgi:predicted DCC family thiol-disulfide oxidoreductase YuxK
MKKYNYIIIYDDACPMCAAYTSGFVKAGLLENQNRQAFSTADPSLLCQVDIKKSVNEIPLIDTRNNKVYYGIDAMLQVLAQKIPLIKTIGNIKPVKWFLLRLYRFISYNRKVIVAKATPANGFDCSPDLNVKYRLLFLLVFLLFNTAMLSPLHRYVLDNSMFASADYRHFQLAHALFVLMNISLCFVLPRRVRLEYLGQVNMLALTMILLSLPLLLLNKYFSISAGINNFFLGMITIVILKEYARRMVYAGIQHHRMIIILNIICLLTFLLYLIF